MTDSPMNRRGFLKTAGAGVALSAAILAARPAAAKQDKVTLTFMHWGDLNEKTAITNVIKKFEEANSNITIDQRHVPDDYGTKLNTLAAANDLPDLFHMSEGPAHAWAADGKIMDMTQYRDKYPVFGDRLPQTFYYYAPGKTFGTMNAAEIMMLFYNREMFEESGVTPPPAKASEALSWDEFVALAKSVTVDNSGKTANDPDFDGDNIRQYGISFPRGWLGWFPLVKSNGGDLTDADATTFTLNSDEGAEVIQKLQDLIYVHKVAPTPSQAENLPATSVQLQSRRVAMVIDGQWSLLSLGEAQVPVGVAVLPTLKTPTTVIVGSITAVHADTEHPDEALAFWLFHNDPVHNLDLFARGLMMPLEEKYYIDQASIDLWTKNSAHPDGYIDAGVNYLKDNSISSPVVLKDFEKIDAAISAGLDAVWLNKATAKDALDTMASDVQALLKGKYPSGSDS
ncbi:MAG: sugar ABC transporter substrate-binding protein [Thermomicrobiales bacterium]